MELVKGSGPSPLWWTEFWVQQQICCDAHNLLDVLGLALGVLKQRRSATRGGWYEFVSCPTICCFSRHDGPSRTVCCDGRGCSRCPVGRVARPEALRKTLRGRPGPHIALLVPAGSDARLPLPSRLPLLCVKRRQGAGAGREGHKGGRHSFRQPCRRSPGPVA